MSLKSQFNPEIPAETVRVARAAFLLSIVSTKGGPCSLPRGSRSEGVVLAIRSPFPP